MCSRKDYVAIAAAIHRTSMACNIGKKKDSAQALRLLASDVAATFANDNPRFDRARFLAACGVSGHALIVLLEVLAPLALVLVLAGCAVGGNPHRMERDKFTGERVIVDAGAPLCSRVTLSSNAKRLERAGYARECVVR